VTRVDEDNLPAWNSSYNLNEFCVAERSTGYVRLSCVCREKEEMMGLISDAIRIDQAHNRSRRVA
jgi:hypothetical protein